MALRILPFRQYNENDVVNLYASATVNTKTSDSGQGDAGIFVTVSAGDLTDGPVQYQTNSYLGKTDYPFVGADQLPVVTAQVTPAGTGDTVLGVTLAQTAQQDENGEKLIYYPQKQLELQAVHSGQAVPILTQGIVTLSPAAFDGDIPAPGTNVLTISPGATAGKLTGHATLAAKHAWHSSVPTVGTVIATGNRVNRGLAADQFAGASVGTGAANGNGQYAVVKVYK